MPVSNEEKYLKSIDGTLKDILKELKKQNKRDAMVSLQLDGKELARKTVSEMDKELHRKAQTAMKEYEIPGRL